MGGGAIRAAAKVAGITAATGAIRSITAEHHPVSSAARKAAASARSAAATTDDLKLMVTSNSETGVQRPCLEIDDWVFSDGEEAVASAAEPMPRVVFGGVPTLQEAKEATSELSVALEKAYLSSPNSVKCEGSAGHDSSLSPSHKQVVETKACVTSEISTAPAVPAPAIKAFRFLHESPMAKNVVASIASDPNVWNAVLENPELQQYLQSQRACEGYTPSDMNFGTESVAEHEPKSVVDSSKYAESEHGGGFMDVLQKVKSTVVDMMSNLSDYFQKIFGGKGANGVFLNPDGTARLSADTVMEASFLGLAVMAILVILLKRA